MKKTVLYAYILIASGVGIFTQCSEARTEINTEEANLNLATPANAGQPGQEQLKSQIELGEHLVLIAGCHDCHSPKKMTAKGMEIDYSLALSGHPAKMPPPDIDRSEIERKGLVVTQTLTAWVGPWGISYAANLTPHKTGIGNWTEKHFFTAIREGKHKGIESNRMILPPMPWDMYRNMTDDELRAVFAYLKSIKPVQNVVPPPQPPVGAQTGK